MTSFAVLIALALEFLLPDIGRYRPSAWLEGMMRWIRTRFRDSAFWLGWPGVLVTLAAAPALVGVAAEGLDGSGGLMQSLLLLFSAAVLALCLRARVTSNKRVLLENSEHYDTLPYGHIDL